MADDASKPQPVVLRIKLRYEDADAMAQRFAANVGRSGLFLPTKAIQPIGAELKFELRLANDTPVLVGMGRVKAAREPDPARPRAAFGMAIELMRVTRESRALILQMLERRRQLGMADVAIPTPDDVDQARRIEVDSGPVRTPFAGPVTAPIAVQVVTDAGASGPFRALDASASGPMAAAADATQVSPEAVPAASEPPPADSLLTAPRRRSGPFAVVKGEPAAPAVAALAPEAPRKPRPRVEDVLERAGSGAVVMTAVPELDDDVDVAAAVLRARAIAASGGGDVDAELASLLDAAAAPQTIDIEAASAELARQLGGVAIARRSPGSGGWAPPPAVVDAPAVEPEPVAGEPVAPEPVAAAADPRGSLFPPEPTPVPAYPRGLLIHDQVDAAQFDAAAQPSPSTSGSYELSDDDLQELEGEHTMIGALPVAPDGYETIPAASDSLADRLDAELAEAEAEADADLDMDRDRVADDAGDDGGYETLPADGDHSGDAEPVPLVQAAAGEQIEQVGDDDIEQIEDFEILAEADADDADLLSSDGERDASNDHAPAYAAPPEPEPEPEPEPDLEPAPDAEPPGAAYRRRASTPPPPDRAVHRDSDLGAAYRRRYAEPDFDYGRLDLGDESSPSVAPAPPPAATTDDDLERALAADSDRPSNYTIEAAPAPAGADDGMDFDEPHAAFEATNYDDPQSALERALEVTPTPGPAPVPTRARPPSRAGRHVEPVAEAVPEDAEIDLDSALHELDVTDDFNAREPGPAPAPSPRPRTAKPRAMSEDGVVIDFDDDDD
nr:hypothetical protein [Kofleriaceae bacterium]